MEVKPQVLVLQAMVVGEDKMIWLTGDQHFGHENIIEYCGRPYGNASLMDADMISKWNEKVNPEDTVVHIGDFIFKHKSIDLIRPFLNGTIILIKGNHDKRAILEQMTWVPYMFMRIGTKYCLINHRPMYDAYEEDKYRDSDPNLSRELLRGVDYIICGHVHEKWLWHGRNYNVGVDHHKFYPISIDEVRVALENH